MPRIAMNRYLSTSLKVILLAAMAAVSRGADDKTTTETPPAATLDGTVTLSEDVVAAGVGYKWGRGTLSYKGQDYKFCVRGLSVGDVGAANMEAQGSVYNLKSIGDFPGQYFELSTGAAIARGQTSALLKNKRGVMIELASRVTGVRFNIGATGLKVILVDHPGCKPAK